MDDDRHGAGHGAEGGDVGPATGPTGADPPGTDQPRSVSPASEPPGTVAPDLSGYRPGLPRLTIPEGPLDRATAVLALQHADQLMEQGHPDVAAGLYQRVVGFDDPVITASAMYGLGNALYRLDREDIALATWEQVLQLPETPTTYLAWRQIAAQRVRDGDLQGAIKAYREADRRAPAADKAEIASRLGWLAKETGDSRGAARQFRRSRGTWMPIATYVIIAITVVVSVAAWAGYSETPNGPDYGQLYPLLWLDKAGVAAGEYWRLVTVALVHDPTILVIHLGFNMYALYLVGPVVEQIYGSARMVFMYVATAITASVASFIATPIGFSTGASGAVFGLFGVLFIASRVHRPVLDRRSRAVLGQVGGLILINLLFGFGFGGGSIDNAAHVGGLLGGLWLGFVMEPAGGPTLASMWRRPDGSTGGRHNAALIQVIGVAALAVAVVAGIVAGDAGYQRAPGTGVEATVSVLDRPG
jgi:membrane associated rhomboid family serine protease